MSANPEDLKSASTTLYTSTITTENHGVCDNVTQGLKTRHSGTEAQSFKTQN